MYRRPLGRGEVLYFTLGHCRSRYDMDPPFTGMEWPTTDRGSWELSEFLRAAAPRAGLGHRRLDSLASA